MNTGAVSCTAKLDLTLRHPPSNHSSGRGLERSSTAPTVDQRGRSLTPAPAPAPDPTPSKHAQHTPQAPDAINWIKLDNGAPTRSHTRSPEHLPLTPLPSYSQATSYRTRQTPPTPTWRDGDDEDNFDTSSEDDWSSDSDSKSLSAADSESGVSGTPPLLNKPRITLAQKLACRPGDKRKRPMTHHHGIPLAVILASEKDCGASASGRRSVKGNKRVEGLAKRFAKTGLGGVCRAEYSDDSDESDDSDDDDIIICLGPPS